MHIYLRKRSIKKQVWLDEKEDNLLKEKAKIAGQTQSGYIRSLILGYKPKELPNSEVHEMLNQIRGIAINLNQIARKANALNYIDVPKYKKVCDKLTEIEKEIKAKILDRY